MFVVTNICHNKSFVNTKYFVTTKDVFCCNKHVFVTTKLVTTKNDTCGSSRQ